MATNTAKWNPAELFTQRLGAAKKQLAQVEKDIVAEARKQRKSLEKALGRVTNANQLKSLEKRLSTTALDLQKRVKTMPREVLGVLGVATSDDVARITKSVTKLTKRVDEISKSRPVA